MLKTQLKSFCILWQSSTHLHARSLLFIPLTPLSCTKCQTFIMDSRDEPPWQLTDFISSPQWGVDTVLNNPPKIQATHSCTKSVFWVSVEKFLTTPPQLLFTQGETKLSIERLSHQHVAWRASGCLYKYTEGERKKRKRRNVPLQPSSPHDAIFQQQYQSCHDCKTVPSCLAVL